MTDSRSLFHDLADLSAAIIAVVVYTVLGVLDVPFLAFCWLLAIPVCVGWRFATRGW